MEWVFAALNSVEMASLPWAFFRFTGDPGDSPGAKWLDDFVAIRLQRLEPVLAGREWLAGTFSIADLLMADVLRLVDRFDGLTAHPACRDYVARATARPAFAKAHGAGGATVTRSEDFEAVFREALAADGPFVIDLRLDPEAINPMETLAGVRRGATTK